MRAKILIIGGGVMGVSIARYVAKRCDPLTEPVILLERNRLAAGSSGRSGAILRQQYVDRVTAAMARDSLKEYSTFQRRIGRPIGFIQSGVLAIAGAEQKESLQRNVEMQRSIGIDVHSLDAAGIRKLVPGIEVSDEVTGAFEPGAGLVDPVRTVEAIAALARSYGATTRLGVQVEDLIVEDGKVCGAETTSGPFAAEQVVLAAGPWSGGLLARAGVDLPLTVLRPEQSFFAMPEVQSETTDEDESDGGGSDADLDARFTQGDEESPPPSHPILLDLEYGCYSKCEPGELRTRVGRMEYEGDQLLDDPDDLEEDVSDEFREQARAALCKRMPVYHDLADVGAQAGWYTMTPDAQAIIGPAPGIEGLTLVTGFSGHGFKLGPSVGEGVAQMLFGDPISAFDPEFFSPDRFEKNAAPQRSLFGL